MVGDRDPRVTGPARRTDHVLEGVAAVRLGGVDVDDPFEIFLRNESRELAALGRFDLAGAFPELRLDEGQSQRGIDLGFARAREPALRRLAAEEAILVQLQTHPLRAAAQERVVLLRAGEIEERGGEFLFADDPKVGGEAVGETNGRLRRAVGGDLDHPGQRPEAGAERLGFAGPGDEIQVAHDFLASPQTPRDLERRREAGPVQGFEDFGGAPAGPEVAVQPAARSQRSNPLEDPLGAL